MSVTGGPDISTDGLILCLDAGNKNSYPGSGNTWYDLSGYNNHATLVNGPTFDGQNKGSISFDGAGDYVSIPNSSIINPTNSITMSTIAYLDNWTISKYGKFLSKTQNGSWQLFHNHLNFGGYGFVGCLIFYGGAYRDVRYSTLNLSTGWHFIDATCDGRYLYLYVDSIRVSTYDLGSTGIISTTTNHLVIGAEPGTGTSIDGDYFNGLISNTKIYNRALTADEIQQNFNATKGRFGL
jgi:hypothetical protein